MESKNANKYNKSFLYENIAQKLSFVEDYNESLKYEDYDESLKDKDKILEKDSLKKIRNGEITEDYRPQDAIKTIESIADSNQVIFINEAHHIALHRAFSIRLLKILYDKGFRYFAAETLAPDADLNSRGYPLINESGYYTNEPVYGDLIRTALKIGYTVVPYENEIPCKKPLTKKDLIAYENGDKENFNWDCMNHREYQQALNLYNRILKKDPAAKIFVHAGYGHIAKKGDGYRKPMGAYFQEITGIVPVSINQEIMREHSNPQFEEKNYKYVLEKFNFTDPIILQSKEKKIWGKGRSEGLFDMFVFHPRTKLIHGRPDWQLFNGLKTPYFIKNIHTTGEFPYLISACIKKEDPNAVPIDQIMIADQNSNNKPLFLPKGEFTIKIRDKSGKLIEESVVMVKKNKNKLSIVQGSK
jgi:hypothetical protein